MKYVFLHDEIEFFIDLIRDEMGYDSFFVDRCHINIISIEPLKLSYKTKDIECFYAFDEVYYFSLKHL